MGLLRIGKPMHWHDALPYRQYVQEHGVQQFLNIYDRLKDRKDDVLKWGDEVRTL
jgi:glutamate--cysteine ligase catalytic subunit